MNNAGILEAAPVSDMSTEVFRRVMDFNLTSQFVLTREALPHVRKTRGNFVFISSLAGDAIE